MTVRAARILALVLLVGLAAAAFAHRDELQALLVEAGPRGAGWFGAAILLLVTGCFPVSVLGFTAGALYGPWLGLGVLVPAVLGGGVLMLGLGRSVLRDPIRRRLADHPRLASFDRLAGRRGLRLNLLARLAPFNYGLVCYGLAAGGGSTRHYLVGLLGAVPSLVGHVTVGALVATGAADGQAGPVRTAATILAALAVAALGWQVGRLARAAWNEADAGADEH